MQCQNILKVTTGLFWSAGENRRPACFEVPVKTVGGIGIEPI
ncbi:hypothetical protein [Kamptonema formosum]|nr:hypothetical protein [Oscillatoria sp. PCC 10802]